MTDDVIQMKAKLWVLARAWRLGWSDFDGRTLRSQIEGVIGDTPDDLDLLMSGQDGREWMRGEGICTECGCWHWVCGCEAGA